MTKHIELPADDPDGLDTVRGMVYGCVFGIILLIIVALAVILPRIF